MILDYTIAEFLGTWLIGYPIFIYFSVVIFKGLFWLIENFFEDDTKKNFFHHHFHYKDRRGK